MQRPRPIFNIESLDFAVAGRRLLDGVDIAFGEGEISALVGHNGSGKSTLLKLLARQIRPTAGNIGFAGQPIQAYGNRDFARKVAYLPQDLNTASAMTVGELVACGRYPWHGPLGRLTGHDRAKIDEAIALTHLEPLAGRMVDTLSGGERQRAWIAMLMAQDSACLLLDEPTSALDIAHQLEILSLIRRLSASRKLSVVIVLHDINMAARFADRILALRSGRLVAQGLPAAILNAVTLEEIYGVPMATFDHPVLGTPLAYVR